ncbi:hypothetical protein ACRC7T_14065 [Segnochrobactraceae bacterium EtOH-i3]
MRTVIMDSITAKLSRMNPEEAAHEAAAYPGIGERILTLYDTAAGPERAADARHVLAARKSREAR